MHHLQQQTGWFACSMEIDKASESSNTTVSKSEIAKLMNHSERSDRKKIGKQSKALEMRRIRKWLIPKNAVAALYELQGPGMMDCVVSTVGHMMKAEIVVNNVKYVAIGSNKKQAKAKACEKALRDIAISQMTRMKQHQEAKVAALAASKTRPPIVDLSLSEKETDREASMHGSEMDVDEEGKTDDLPIKHLASFALHKLFSEWEIGGFEIPALKSLEPTTGVVSSNGTTVGLPKVVKTVANLPPDAAKRNPSALFSYMRPQVAYEDLGGNEDPLNCEFTAAINVDGMSFVGHGRSKKLARKAAAVDACKALFGVEFDSSVL